jgi:hypothetical protein
MQVQQLVLRIAGEVPGMISLANSMAIIIARPSLQLVTAEDSS